MTDSLYTGLENLETMASVIRQLIGCCERIITISSIPTAGMRRSPRFGHFRTNPDRLLMKLIQNTHKFPSNPFPITAE